MKMQARKEAEKDQHEKDLAKDVFYACRHGTARQLSDLLDDGASVDIVDPWTDTNTLPLHAAALCGNHACAALLLRSGADVNCVDLVGCTPLMNACYNGRHRVVELLCSKGADIMKRNVNGANALQYAEWDLIDDDDGEGMSEAHRTCRDLLFEHCSESGLRTHRFQQRKCHYTDVRADGHYI